DGGNRRADQRRQRGAVELRGRDGVRSVAATFKSPWRAQLARLMVATPHRIPHGRSFGSPWRPEGRCYDPHAKRNAWYCRGHVLSTLVCPWVALSSLPSCWAPCARAPTT